MMTKVMCSHLYLLIIFPDSPTALAQILREARDSMTSMQTALDRYASLLDTNTPEVLQEKQIFVILSCLFVCLPKLCLA